MGSAHHSEDSSKSPPRPTESILVVDDDLESLRIAQLFLQNRGYAVQTAGCAKELRALYDTKTPDVVLLDWWLPDAEGLDLIPELQARWPETPVVMLTGNASMEAAVASVKRGAFHFHNKPFHAEELLRIIREACKERRRHLAAANTPVPGGVGATNGLVLAGVAMQELVKLVDRVAPSEASILITGESGSGKEVVADLVHARSARAGGPMVKVNCAAFPRDLLESELFGCVKGAFTGAHADRSGLFQQARGGTLMLDEICEMPLEMQSKLLRVLQHREYRPVGATTTVQTDCRVIAATNRNIDEALASNRLRADLFYRISTITLHVPPLRDRKEAIIPLAKCFLQLYAQRVGKETPGLSEDAAEALNQFDWPGNIRQLENEIHRAVLVCEDSLVRKRDLFFTKAAIVPPAKRKQTRMADLEMNAILDALKLTAGNKAAAAKHLGLTRQTLYNKLHLYGLEIANSKQKPPSSQENSPAKR